MAERLRASITNSRLSSQQSVAECVFKHDSNNYCLVLHIGRKAVGPVYCVPRVKYPSANKREGVRPGVTGCTLYTP